MWKKIKEYYAEHKAVQTDVLGEASILGVGLASGALFTTQVWPLGIGVLVCAAILAWKKPWKKN